VLLISAQLVADGKVEVPIAARYRLDQVREAYDELERRHTRGKIVLVNAPTRSPFASAITCAGTKATR
jgi:hypothetical protein